jgi:hypothetical protein
MYEINHPAYGEVDGLESWFNGGMLLTFGIPGPKSFGYRFDLDDADDNAKFWESFGGRGTLLLAPVEVPNPLAATTFFEGNAGKVWNYLLIGNNCKNYVCDGLRTGGAQIDTTGPSPALWFTNFTMYWNKTMDSPAQLPKWTPNLITKPNWFDNR